MIRLGLAQRNKIDLNYCHADLADDLVVGERDTPIEVCFQFDVGGPNQSIQCFVPGKPNGAHGAQNCRSNEWKGAASRSSGGHGSDFGL